MFHLEISFQKKKYKEKLHFTILDLSLLSDHVWQQGIYNNNLNTHYWPNCISKFLGYAPDILLNHTDDVEI